MNDAVVLKADKINKSFPGVHALKNACLELRRGETHVLMGENGAGKSVLTKILTGIYQPDSGTIYFEGQPLALRDAKHAQDIGINVVHQEFNLVPQLTVLQNIFIGRELSKGVLLNKKEMRRLCQEAFDKIGARVDMDELVQNLGVAEQQMVEIAKGLTSDSKVLFLDEPSAVLSDEEINHLFEVIRKLCAAGAAVVYISHRMDEINQIGDRVTVFRDGEYIQTLKRGENGFDMEEIVHLMVGRVIDDSQVRTSCDTGEEALRVEHLVQDGVLHDISMHVNKGEIVGLAGLVGAGRSELAKAIFGCVKLSGGRIYVHGKEVSFKRPHDAIAHGVGLVPEDRKAEGLILGMSVETNVVLASLKSVCGRGVVSSAKVTKTAQNRVSDLRIKTPSTRQHVVNLSGGNQQKVVLGKWLTANSEIIIFDEPTRGIDIGAKQEVYELMDRLASQGAAIIMISSELPEILRMSDRILVMHEGSLQGELKREDATQDKILYLASGGMIDE